MSRVEQPNYSVVRADGLIEIRQYGAMVVAETSVMGERKAAIGQGFSRIAGYIFGANTPKAKIAMTAPVLQQSDGTSNLGTAWTTRFMMPRGWTMETLPLPDSANVKLQLVPAKQMVVIRFSGSANEAAIQRRTLELRTYATAQALVTVGAPVLAFYNPPWTLPVFRRNEVMLELREPTASR